MFLFSTRIRAKTEQPSIAMFQISPNPSENLTSQSTNSNNSHLPLPVPNNLNGLDPELIKYYLKNFWDLLDTFIVDAQNKPFYTLALQEIQTNSLALDIVIESAAISEQNNYINELKIYLTKCFLTQYWHPSLVETFYSLLNKHNLATFSLSDTFQEALRATADFAAVNFYSLDDDEIQKSCSEASRELFRLIESSDSSTLDFQGLKTSILNFLKEWISSGCSKENFWTLVNEQKISLVSPLQCPIKTASTVETASTVVHQEKPTQGEIQIPPKNLRLIQGLILSSILRWLNREQCDQNENIGVITLPHGAGKTDSLLVLGNLLLAQNKKVVIIVSHEGLYPKYRELCPNTELTTYSKFDHQELDCTNTVILADDPPPRFAGLVSVNSSTHVVIFTSKLPPLQSPQITNLSSEIIPEDILKKQLELTSPIFNSPKIISTDNQYENLSELAETAEGNIVVFVKTRKEAKELYEYLRDKFHVAKYTGETPPEQRALILDKFKDSTNTPQILIVTTIGQTHHHQFPATTVIFFGSHCSNPDIQEKLSTVANSSTPINVIFLINKGEPEPPLNQINRPPTLLSLPAQHLYPHRPKNTLQLTIPSNRDTTLINEKIGTKSNSKVLNLPENLLKLYRLYLGNFFEKLKWLELLVTLKAEEYVLPQFQIKANIADFVIHNENGEPIKVIETKWGGTNHQGTLDNITAHLTKIIEGIIEKFGNQTSTPKFELHTFQSISEKKTRFFGVTVKSMHEQSHPLIKELFMLVAAELREFAKTTDLASLKLIEEHIEKIICEIVGIESFKDLINLTVDKSKNRDLTELSEKFNRLKNSLQKNSSADFDFTSPITQEPGTVTQGSRFEVLEKCLRNSLQHTLNQLVWPPNSNSPTKRQFNESHVTTEIRRKIRSKSWFPSSNTVNYVTISINQAIISINAYLSDPNTSQTNQKKLYLKISEALSELSMILSKPFPSLSNELTNVKTLSGAIKTLNGISHNLYILKFVMMTGETSNKREMHKKLFWLKNCSDLTESVVTLLQAITKLKNNERITDNTSNQMKQPPTITWSDLTDFFDKTSFPTEGFLQNGQSIMQEMLASQKLLLRLSDETKEKPWWANWGSRIKNQIEYLSPDLQEVFPQITLDNLNSAAHVLISKKETLVLINKLVSLLSSEKSEPADLKTEFEELYAYVISLDPEQTDQTEQTQTSVTKAHILKLFNSFNNKLNKTFNFTRGRDNLENNLKRMCYYYIIYELEKFQTEISPITGSPLTQLLIQLRLNKYGS